MDDDSTIASEYYNEFKEASNITSSSSPPYYDELITKLHLQSMEEYGILRWQQQQQQRQQKLQEEQKEELHDQKTNKRRIFLVDDEPDHCMVYQIVLQDAGYECISYTDSVKALQEFRADYYDLVILDIKMPVLNGFELCKRIIEIYKTVQIIFVTALPEYFKDIREQSYPELRNTIYIQKPISNEELTEIVNETLATGSAN
jgi:CheY-like chemotaxis protein